MSIHLSSELGTMTAFNGVYASNIYSSGYGFNLYSNELTGSIPSQLGRLSMLTGYFQLQDNDLCGLIPTEIARLSSLVANHSALISDNDDSSEHWNVGGNSGMGAECSEG